MKIASNKLLDTRYEIAAPEFIFFQCQLAGPSVRLLSILFDHFILLIVMIVLLIFLVIVEIFNMSGYTDGKAGIAQFMIFIALFIIYWFFFFIQELFLRGRTIGKMAFKLRVISIDGTSLDAVQILIRNLLRFADMFPIVWGLFPTYFVGLLACFFDPLGFRRLGDLAAGTLVIRENRKGSLTVPVSERPEILELSAKMKLKYIPSHTLALAINNYADSLPRLHPLRAEEIAQKVADNIRIVFSAQDLICSPVDLMIAAHVCLNKLEKKDLLHTNASNLLKNPDYITAGNKP